MERSREREDGEREKGEKEKGEKSLLEKVADRIKGGGSRDRTSRGSSKGRESEGEKDIVLGEGIVRRGRTGLRKKREEEREKERKHREAVRRERDRVFRKALMLEREFQALEMEAGGEGSTESSGSEDESLEYHELRRAKGRRALSDPDLDRYDHSPRRAQDLGEQGGEKVGILRIGSRGDESCVPFLREGEDEQLALKKSTTSKSGDFFNALKNHTQLVKGSPTKENLAGWLNNYWVTISNCWPSLKTSEKIRLLSLRLPNEIGKAAANANLKTKSEIFELATTLFGYGGLDESSNYTRFFRATPTTHPGLLAFVNHLTELSLAIDIKEAERPALVLKQIVAYLPCAYRTLIEQREASFRMSGKRINVIDILSPIFSDKAALQEIEKNFKIGKEGRHAGCFQVKSEGAHGVTSSNGEKRGFGEGDQRAPVGNQGKGSTRSNDSNNISVGRCSKCGGSRHVARECQLYKNESKYACSHCETHYNRKHFHYVGDCLNKPRH